MTGCSDVLTLHSRERRLTSPRLEGADQPRRPFDGYQTVAHGLSERELAHVPSRQVFTLGRDDQVVVGAGVGSAEFRFGLLDEQPEPPAAPDVEAHDDSLVGKTGAVHALGNRPQHDARIELLGSDLEPAGAPRPSASQTSPSS